MVTVVAKNEGRRNSNFSISAILNPHMPTTVIIFKIIFFSITELLHVWDLTGPSSGCTLIVV